jgi:protein-L-isoaspartate(D-aspartate) O-methyltransferase
MTDYEIARLNMVENQLRPNRIQDPRVLQAMADVPRERFLPERLRGVAYADEDIPLGGGRFLIEPLALAKLIQAATVQHSDKALVAGDATGYAAAVMARLAGKVHLLLPAGSEPPQTEGLREAAEVQVHTGETLRGLPELAPFDVILLTGAVDRAPQELLHQLADGGRLATVIDERRNGRVTIFRRVGDAFGRTTPFEAGVPRLPDLPAVQAFEF